MVLYGEPGVGKSALLADALARHPELQHLRTRGLPAEAELPFAALQRLLRTIMHYSTRLPRTQREALAVALGEAPGGLGDELTAFLAVLGLLSEAGADKPVMAVIDDAQWLDPSSTSALLFVARRLTREPALLVFAFTGPQPDGFDAEGLTRMHLPGIGAEEAALLLQERSGRRVAPHVADRLSVQTGGNPLALSELATALSVEQLHGQVPLPAALPLPDSVERVYLTQLRSLSKPAQRVLLLAAAEEGVGVATLAKAAGVLGLPDKALDEIERSDLTILSEDGRLEVRQPLIRHVVYNAATTRQRREAHAALAEASSGADGADRRAWHLAASVHAPHEAAAGELRAAGKRARHRGAHESAGAAWERAAQLTSDPATRGRLRFAAAKEVWLAYRPHRARVLADAAALDITDPLELADVQRMRARIQWASGSMQLGHQILLQGARAVSADDPVRAMEMAMLAAVVAAFGGDSGIGICPMEFGAAGSGAAAGPRERCVVLLLRGFQAASVGDWAAAARDLADAAGVDVAIDGADGDLIAPLAIGALLTGDLDRLDYYHQRLLLRARESGAILYVATALNRLTISEVATGRWQEADAHASAALALGPSTRRVPWLGLPRATRLLVAALCDDASFDARLAEAEHHPPVESAILLEPVRCDVVRWARGIHASTPGEAFHHFSQMGHPVIQRLAAMDRIEAAVDLGRRDEAEQWIADLAQFGEATGQAWASAIAEHGRALLAGRGSAEAHFQNALRLHESSPRVFEQARTRLAYGRMLRRARRRLDARDPLRQAMHTFADLRAASWAAQAARELRAAGEKPADQADSDPVDLTPQERQVVELVRQGLTNQAAADALMLSRRTVEFHLRNIYAKTGITTRHGLGRLDLL